MVPRAVSAEAYAALRSSAVAGTAHDVVIVSVLIRPFACPSACVDRGHPRIGANEDLAIPECR